MDEVPDRINAAALLLARGTPRRPALVCDERSLSYGELQRNVARAARRWREHGVEPGEVVMLRGDHGLAHAVAFLGAMWAGAVPVPLRASASQDDPAALQFAVDGARPHAGQVNGHGTTRWRTWRDDLADAAPLPAVACDPWAPACWTEPRTWNAGKARVLPHRFALTLSAQAGVLPLTPARTMLAVLRTLRRGSTVVLHHPAHAVAAAP
jgi:non-ribosomal peptide synthetase component F